MKANICFIGGGAMAEAIISGLRNGGTQPEQISVSDLSAERREYLITKFGVSAFASNSECVKSFSSAGKSADVVLFAVKPQVVAGVVKEITQCLHSYPTPPIIMSIVAGVNLVDLENWTTVEGATPLPIVRLMPNTPALIGEGAAGIICNSVTTDSNKLVVTELVSQIAKEIFWVKNDTELDYVTAISGSGPAYFFLFIEAMKNYGIKMGLSEDTSLRLAAQTGLGASKMVLNSTDSVETLRRKVTSPNGTTHAAVEKMIALGVPEFIDQGCVACADRSKELGIEFGKN